MENVLSSFIIFIEKFFNFTIVGRITIFDIFFYIILISGFFFLFKNITKGGQ